MLVLNNIRMIPSLDVDGEADGVAGEGEFGFEFISIEIYNLVAGRFTRLREYFADLLVCDGG